MGARCGSTASCHQQDSRYVGFGSAGNSGELAVVPESDEDLAGYHVVLVLLGSVVVVPCYAEWIAPTGVQSDGAQHRYDLAEAQQIGAKRQ